MSKTAFGVFLCVFIAGAASAQSRKIDVDGQARQTSKVVVAKVIDVTSRFGTSAAGDQLIYSDLLLDVSETLKGDMAPVLTVTVEGGQVGDIVLSVSDMPVMRRGERALYFLNLSAQGKWVPHRRGAGILKMDQSEYLQEAGMSLPQAKALIRNGLK